MLVSAPPLELDPSPKLRAAWDEEEEALNDGDIDAATAAVLDAWLLPDAPDELRRQIGAMQSRALELQLDAPEAPEAPDPLEQPGAARRSRPACARRRRRARHARLPRGRDAAGARPSALPSRR